MTSRYETDRYTFTPWHTGLVAHLGDLYTDGEFFVVQRPCVGYTTTISRYRDGNEWVSDPQTSLAVLDDEFPYVVRGLDDLQASEPSLVIVAVLPVGEAPTPERLAEAERFARLCHAMHERGVEKRKARTHPYTGRTAA